MPIRLLRYSAMSKIQDLIENPDFSYLKPYFYENSYALRCELATGETHEIRMQNALDRAMQIYKILFPDQKADALIFNHWRYDGEPEEDISEFLNQYQHRIIRNLPVYDWDEEYKIHTHRNRIICYAEHKNFNHQEIIKNLIYQDFGRQNHEESFVSFSNECIFSIYDDRGCDIVFAESRKFRDFYHILEPFFLDYDRNLMQKRLDNLQ